MSYLNIIGICLTELVGDVSLKYFANEGGIKNLLGGIGGYIGVMYFLIRSLQGSTYLLVNTAWDALSTVISSLFAFFYLGERFKTPSEYFGFVLIILGLYFLKIPFISKTKFVFPKL